MTRVKAAAALLAMATLLGPLAARADDMTPSSSAALCANQGGQTPPTARAAACTALIATGKLTPDQEAVVLSDRAWSLSLLGRMADAHADYERAITVSPKSHVAHNEYGLFLLRTGQYDAAVAQYDIALRLRPGAPYSLFGRGLALIRKGDRKTGEDDLAKARLAESGVDKVFLSIGLQP